jgi:hypothetical protein
MTDDGGSTAAPARYPRMRRVVTTQLLAARFSRGHPGVDPALEHSDLLSENHALAAALMTVAA